jgi:hypothetical protein
LTKPSASRSWANWGSFLNSVRSALVGRREMQLGRGGGEHALADQGVERHAAHLRRLEHPGVDAGICRRARSTRSRREFLELHLADLAAVDGGHCAWSPPSCAVALDSEEHERRNTSSTSTNCRTRVMATEEIEHGRCRCEKGEP